MPKSVLLKHQPLDNEKWADIFQEKNGDIFIMIAGGPDGAIVRISLQMVFESLGALEDNKDGWLAGHWIWVKQRQNAVIIGNWPFSKYDRQTLTHRELVTLQQVLIKLDLEEVVA